MKHKQRKTTEYSHLDLLFVSRRLTSQFHFRFDVSKGVCSYQNYEVQWLVFLPVKPFPGVRTVTCFSPQGLTESPYTHHCQANYAPEIRHLSACLHKCFGADNHRHHAGRGNGGRGTCTTVLDALRAQCDQMEAARSSTPKSRKRAPLKAFLW